jgi:hypothetical protein
MNKKLLIVALVFTAITIIARLLPHMPNVVPMAALALFAGVYLPKKWSIAVPMAAMLISDSIIGFYEWQVVVAVYLGFALTIMIGWQLKNRISPLATLSGALSGSVVFFLLTNAAVWAFSSLYPATGAGLMDSYLMALPFFKFSVVGDLAWTTVFFVGYQFILKHFPAAQLSKNQESSLSTVAQ